MLFDVVGPFELTRHGKKTKLLTKQSLKDLKSDLEGRKRGLSRACGCYVFAIRAGKGWKPYYVGQACKLTIPDEALNASNINKYNQVCSEGKGTPVIFALPIQTPGGKFKKKGTGGRSIDFLERWLIAQAILRNPDLINNKETMFLRQIQVVGIFNAGQGRRPRASNSLWKVLWRRPQR
jgi:hypothetical protein